MEEEKKNICEVIIEQVECELEKLTAEGIRRENIDYAGKLVDVHKDLKNEKYWIKKEEYYNEIQRLRRI